LFQGRNDKWKEVTGHWWKLCKRSDVTGQETFYREFDELSDYILSNGYFSSEKEKANKKKWLSNMKAKPQQWASCYTWSRKTYGAHSTGRAEAINFAIKSFCSKHSLITDLMLDLDREKAAIDGRITTSLRNGEHYNFSYKFIPCFVAR
jgi:hypothetical protein